MSAAEKQATADSCPQCGSTSIKTWKAMGTPMAVCNGCKHRWTLFVPKWREQAARKAAAK